MTKSDASGLPDFEEEVTGYREALRQQGLPPEAIEKMVEAFRAEVEAAARRQREASGNDESTEA